MSNAYHDATHSRKCFETWPGAANLSHMIAHQNRSFARYVGELPRPLGRQKHELYPPRAGMVAESTNIPRRSVLYEGGQVTAPPIFVLSATDPRALRSRTV